MSSNLPISHDIITSEKGGIYMSNKIENIEQVMPYLSRPSLITIVVSPEIDKTDLALEIAKCKSEKSNTNVVFFTLENGGKSMLNNLDIADKNSITIYEKECYTVSEMIEKLNSAKDIGLAVINYFQLIHAESKEVSRIAELSVIAHKLKNSSQILKIPILVLYHLSKNIDYSCDRHLLVRELREKGSLEMDSDVIMYLCCDPEIKADRCPEKYNDLKCIITKNRYGDIGTIHLH